MAITGSFPNVYPSIRDISQVVMINSTTACAYVGEAEFGPINTPTLVTNLRNYTDRFGSLSPRFGYMGYSLAVAAETIPQHWVVRVVDEETARYGSVAINKNGSTSTRQSVGYTHAEVLAAQIDPGALFVDGSLIDTETAFIAVANNPNDRQYRISVVDTTINENRQIRALATEGDIATGIVTVTLPSENEFAVGDTIVVSHSSDEAYNGTFKVATVENTYSYSANVSQGGTGWVVNDTFIVDGVFLADGVTPLTGSVLAVGTDGVVTTVELDITTGLTEIPNNTYPVTNTSGSGVDLVLAIKSTIQSSGNIITYITSAVITQTNPTSVRVVLFPVDNETTFGIRVHETVGRVTSMIEEFPVLTLYDNQDNFGNSTLITDVINSRSNFIQVFVNPYNTSVVPAVTTLAPLANGTSGSKPTPVALNAGWDLFMDRSRMSVTLLLNSGYVNTGDFSYQSKMLEVAERRRDCFCLFDIPMTETPWEAAIDWRRNTQGFNTYRASLTSPWIQTFDTTQGRANFLMPPSAFIAKMIGANGGRPWMAPAGANRGIVSAATTTPTGLTQYYDVEVGGLLYESQINSVIRNTGGSGYAVWGQKTLQQRPSAMDRMNVARTIIFIETVLRDAARYHLFENNTAFERLQITMQFNQFLDTILTAGGIAEYNVVCNDTNNPPSLIARNQLAIDIYIRPTYAAEFIALTTVVVGPTATVHVG